MGGDFLGSVVRRAGDSSMVPCFPASLFPSFLEGTCKPDSVPLNWIQGRQPFLWDRRHRRPQAAYPEAQVGPTSKRLPIWPCSARGFPCLRRCRRSGGLLPRLFTLTLGPRGTSGGIFSVALSVGSRLPAVSRLAALWSPDFPLRSAAAAARSPPSILYAQNSLRSMDLRYLTGRFFMGQNVFCLHHWGGNPKRW
jgi:hypothetical protein